MRGWHLLPLGLVLIVLVGLPVVALTHTGLEQEVKSDLGFSSGECEPMTNPASAWTAATSLSYNLDEPRGIALDGSAYLVGGITGLTYSPPERILLEPSNELTRFDPRTESFEELAPLPRPTSHMGVVSYNHDLYIVGGYGNRLDAGTSKAFYRYDTERDEWSRMPDMPKPLAAMAAGVVGDRLIVAGGAVDDLPVTGAFSFDFHSGRWSRLPDMPTLREHVGATVLGDRLYVLGGRTPNALASNTAEAYDVSERRWTSLPPMPVESGGLGAVSADGDVIAVGGGNDQAETVTGAVQEWDPRSGEWSLLPEMRTPRHGEAVVAVGDRVWVFGGSPCAFYNPTDSVEELKLGEADDGQG
jgi:hypothetical protein